MDTIRYAQDTWFSGGAARLCQCRCRGRSMLPDTWRAVALELQRAYSQERNQQRRGLSA